MIDAFVVGFARGLLIGGLAVGLIAAGYALVRWWRQ